MKYTIIDDSNKNHSQIIDGKKKNLPPVQAIEISEKKPIHIQGNTLQTLFYFYVSKNIEDIVAYLENSYFFGVDILEFFEKRQFGDIINLYWEASNIPIKDLEFIGSDKKQKPFGYPLNNDSEILRLFLSFTFSNVPETFDKKELFNELAIMINQAIVESMSMPDVSLITKWVLTTDGFYKRNANIITDSLMILPDVQIRFNASVFDSDFTLFKQKMGSLQPSVIYKAQIDQDSNEFYLSPLHPDEAKNLLMKLEDKLSPEIIGLGENRPISMDQLDELIDKYGKYYPESNTINSPNRVLLSNKSDGKKKKKKYIHPLIKTDIWD